MYPRLMRNRRSTGPYSPAVFHIHFHILLDRLYLYNLRGIRTCRTLRSVAETLILRDAAPRLAA